MRRAAWTVVERNRLARVVARGMFGRHPPPPGLEPQGIDFDVVRAVVAAGYRPPQRRHPRRTDPRRLGAVS